MAQQGRFLAPDIGRHLLREEDEVVVDEVTHHWVAYLPAAAYGAAGLVLVLFLGYWLVQAPNSFAQVLQDTAGWLWRTVRSLFESVIDVLNSLGS